MQENMRLNQFDPSSITLHTEGIAAERGTATFEDDGFSSVVVSGDQSRPFMYWLKFTVKKLLNSVGIGDYGQEVDRMTKISTIPLDELMGRVGAPVDLLQMDVQGLEGDILSAATATLKRGTIETLLIGTHSDAVHARCLELLTAGGYRIIHDDPNPGTQPDGMIVATKRPEAAP
ncbi:MAG: FkbM family methyltransferase [Pseudohongiellaceae bacterium]|jgi:FkbM family methyltransferase